jgi:hypothetical protein
MSSDSSVDYALNYGIKDRGIRFRVPAGFHNFPAVSRPVHTSLLPSVQRANFPGSNMDGCEPDHSYPSRAEVKTIWSYTFTPSYVCMSWYIIKQMNTSTLLLMIWHMSGRMFTLLDRQTDRQTDFRRYMWCFNFNLRHLVLFFIILNGTFHS